MEGDEPAKKPQLVAQDRANAEISSMVGNRDSAEQPMANDKSNILRHPGLDASTVNAISEVKGEPEWMRQRRQRALQIFLSKPMPTWGANLHSLHFGNIIYFARPTEHKSQSWEDLPPEIRQTYERLGVPAAERRYCAGLQAQYDSEVVYGSLRRELDRQGILFTDTDTAVREHSDLVRNYFGSVVPAEDNKFAALNTAVWSGGAFVYMPAGSKMELPLHGYFRIGAEHIGQFEHTLIVLEEGAELNYIEACTAPIYRSASLHSGVVEIVLNRGARCRFTSIQNWAPHIDNFATKRAIVREAALMEWISGNFGSHLTMAYPSTHLVGRAARAEMLSLCIAGKHQHQDTGAKMIHAAADTTSRIVSKSISHDGGRTTFRGLVQVARGSTGAKSQVSCDSLILDPDSRCDTSPHMDIRERDVVVGHEASVSRLDDEKLFYLMSRGLSETEAGEMVISGFVEPLAKELPLCYASQLNRLIRLKMTKTIG